MECQNPLDFVSLTYVKRGVEKEILWVIGAMTAHPACFPPEKPMTKIDSAFDLGEMRNETGGLKTGMGRNTE